MQIERISWRDLAASLGPVLLISAVAIWAAIHFVRPAPPDTITITSGPDGSIFRATADKYARILARNGIKLKILPSEGSLENLKRLAGPSAQTDVGFVQGGLSNMVDNTGDLVSLGSIFYEPLAIFYRSAKPIKWLSQLKGERIAIGPEGSGTRFLALTLLKANGIEPNDSTKLLDLSGEAAAQAVLKHEADAAFLTGDSATGSSMRELLHAPGIRRFDFVQADAYVLRFPYLSKLVLPTGSLDLGKNLPENPLTMIAPTVELIARDNLHPALSDMLIEAAREVHGHASLLQKAGEFPAPLEHEYRISDEALRYYKSGKSFLYRYLPFWAASLADRTILVLVPVIVLLIPTLRLVPILYGWRIKTRIFRRYGELMALERAALAQTTPEERKELLNRLEEFENKVITTKMPGSYADQLYVLRSHINFVRTRLTEGTPDA
ncbi:MAG TPA: TAXI family TRAP transporter solute-binding subunit [Burkholderiales bacterium]|nr:TAXI family TRAP transporter solute-binding subunit [Burkholderiales bacterium]